MRFISIRIQNYKSFAQSSTIPLASGRNVVVGENNSGKTAFLEAVSLKFGRDPHRTSKRQRDYPLPDISEAHIEFDVSGTELKKILLAVPEIKVPFPPDRARSSENAEAWLDELFRRPNISFSCIKHDNTVVAPRYPGFDAPVLETSSIQTIVKPDPMRSKIVHRGFREDGETQLAVYVAQKFVEQISLFNAERISLAKCSVGANRVLVANARNLAEVLHNLQDSPTRFTTFVELVHRVLPTIHQISVRNAPNNEVEIFVSNYEDSNRDDLFVSLSKSGSGVGQVLAILYVLFSSRDPRTIIIDEPNSFLHPGAVRRLVEVVKEFNDHQFIISTHSPDVIFCLGSS
jgi:predicted ATP-dependent endonuclease of OLD family